MRKVTSIRTLTAIGAGLALVVISALVTASVLPAYPSLAVVPPVTESNWAGIGLRTSTPAPSEVTAEAVLPAPSRGTVQAVIEDIGGNTVASIWAGLGGATPDLAWLSQTIWTVTPSYGWWEVRPCISVDHTTGDTQHFLVNRSLGWPSLVPPGTRLVATLQVPPRAGDPMQAVLIATPPARYHLPVIRYSALIPTFSRETRHWRLAEAVLENPGLSGGVVVDSSHIDLANLPLFSNAVYLKLSVTYPRRQSVQVSVVPYDISRVNAPSATTTLDRITPLNGGAVTASASISVVPPHRSR